MSNTHEGYAGVRFQHFKTGDIYIGVGVFKHSETEEPMVAYVKASDPLNSAWVRPKAMFDEEVPDPSGVRGLIPRFKRLD